MHLSLCLVPILPLLLPHHPYHLMLHFTFHKSLQLSMPIIMKGLSYNGEGTGLENLGSPSLGRVRFSSLSVS
jgi:hypothetical protein